MIKDKQQDRNNTMRIQNHLEEQAYELGKRAFDLGFGKAPHLNKDFTNWLPNGNFYDKDCFLKRIRLYKFYSQGWDLQNLNKKIA